MDQVVPADVIARAKGLALFTVVKAGFLFSGRAGSGIVMARLPDGSWSAPSCIGTGGIGFGGQIGAEMTDFFVLLNNDSAVRAFAHGGNVTLGGNLSVAAGPLGRNAEASGSMLNPAPLFSYSKTKGLFAGVSIEGSVIVERKDSNAKFYGQGVTAKDILTGKVAPPPEAEGLYEQLRIRTEQGRDLAEKRAKDKAAAKAAAAASASSISSAGSYQSPPPTAPKPAAPAGVMSGHYASTNPSPSYTHSSLESKAPVASVPSVASSSSSLSQPPPPPLRPKPTTTAQGPTAVALYDFAGVQEGDLPFKEGDTIVILRKTDSQNDWWTGKCNGSEGSVSPLSFSSLPMLISPRAPQEAFLPSLSFASFCAYRSFTHLLIHPFIHLSPPCHVSFPQIMCNYLENCISLSCSIYHIFPFSFLSLPNAIVYTLSPPAPWGYRGSGGWAFVRLG